MLLAAVGWKAVKARTKLEDGLVCEASHHRQREPAAGVFHARMLAVDGDMGDADIVVARRVAGIEGIELGRRVVRRARPLVALVRLKGRGGGDERYPRFCHRLAERREGRVLMMRPLVGIGIAKREIIGARALHTGNGGGIAAHKLRPAISMSLV